MLIRSPLFETESIDFYSIIVSTLSLSLQWRSFSLLQCTSTAEFEISYGMLSKQRVAATCVCVKRSEEISLSINLLYLRLPFKKHETDHVAQKLFEVLFAKKKAARFWSRLCKRQINYFGANYRGCKLSVTVNQKLRLFLMLQKWIGFKPLRQTN